MIDLRSPNTSVSVNNVEVAQRSRSPTAVECTHILTDHDA